jgi:hypothetical protein
VATLAHPGCLIEIDAIAVADDPSYLPRINLVGR